MRRRTRAEMQRVKDNKAKFDALVKVYQETKRMAKMGHGLFAPVFHRDKEVSDERR